MKNIKTFSDSKLHIETCHAAKNEQLATLQLLDFLAEVDARRLYSTMGFASLWKYVHKSLNYSESQASERVSAMRLMQKIPEVKKELQTGTISLTHVSKLATHVRREKCSVEKTKQLLESIQGKSSRETEKLFCAEATTRARPDQVKAVTPVTTRITIEVDNDFLNLMNRAKELGFHVGSGPQEIFRKALNEFVAKREVKAQKTRTKAKPVLKTPVDVAMDPNTSINIANVRRAALRAPEVKSVAATETLAARPVALGKRAIKAQKSRYISKTIKTQIRIRSGDQCEYIDLKSNRRCSAKSNLQMDHITPFAAQGTNTQENLRHYCANHNQWAAVQFFGVEKMKRSLRTKTTI